MSKLIILDALNLKSIRLSKQRQQSASAYYWDNYSYFAHQRSLISSELKHALLANCQSFSFTSWQRIISYQYSLEPLSAKGSTLNVPGGRFNIGDIDQSKFPRFPALYLAEDRATGFKEKYGLNTIKEPILNTEELNLTKESTSLISVKGNLNLILNLENTETLKDLFDLLKNIKLPEYLRKQARKLNIYPMPHVKSHNELRESILLRNWRDIPMQCGIPANCQILGQIAYAAGVEAILYPSHITQKSCLAIFPEKLLQDSFIQIEGNFPEKVINHRLDATTYQNFI